MDKIGQFQEKMPEQMKAAVFFDQANRFYLTGMRSSAGTVLITREHAWLIIDFRYLEEAEKKVRNCTVLEETSLYSQIAEILREAGISELHIHSGLMSLEDYKKLEAALRGISLDTGGLLLQLMEELRREKDEDEIVCHRKAQQITDHVFSHICNFIRPGMTELDVSKEIGLQLTTLGSDERTFQFIVASGTNSSLPHGFATDRIIQKGDFLTMDFGAVYKGYYADMTRTVAIGSVTEEQHRVYETVLEAQKRALEAIRPGEICRDIDAVARNYIYEAGYRGCFSHGLGHSVGVEVHENPRFNEHCRDRLVPGIVITVEPGIYLKGRFGVRIEDMVVVREDGAEDLTQSPRELIVL